MRRTPLKNAILTSLLDGPETVPVLWERASRTLGKEVPLSTFYEAIYRLRTDRLVTYESRVLTTTELSGFLTELETGTSAEPEAPGRNRVSLTTEGKSLALVATIEALIPAQRRREAAAPIHELQEIIGSRAATA